ncbi:B3 domain-containing protein At3g18960-like [Olea europaea var. sylvestris]|uniref:B3 domain-containing protein At3g18960-like n=1 Tax=Olea europaea var. sylvestris TaxID=158386 RepID=UPI000C1CE86A|nr:B3 domain-containing protein At3g18960-like [Olea europaea var. sylvestris]XP_022897098.1 B3 domain-containing protein At3g18960-like [Olea europaea var. sylvestris]
MERRLDLPARFFKVILPSTTIQHKLRLPNTFVEAYKHELSNVVELTDRIGGIWLVRLEEEEEILWLDRGWDKFFQDQSIEHGYFVLFKYRGNSSFKVHIFDMTATEVHHPLCNSRNFGQTSYRPRNSLPEREEQSDDDSVTIPDSVPTELLARPLRSVAPNGHVVRSRRDEKRSCRGRKRNLGKKAIHNTGTNLLTYPSFTVKMKPNLTPRWVLYVPAQFARDHLPNFPGHIELHDSDGKRWPVSVNMRHGLVRYLCWATFAKAKKIKVGDVCVFELIHVNKPVALKVSKLCKTSRVLRQI